MAKKHNALMLRTRRGIILIALLLPMLFLAGCSSSGSAQRVVEEYFQALQTGDLEKATTMNPRVPALDLPWNKESATKELLMAANSRTQFTVGTAKVDGEFATVAVKEVIPDLQAIIQAYPDSRMRDRFPPADVIRAFAEHIRSAPKLPAKTLEGTITLRKFGRTWLIYGTTGLDWL